MTSVALTLKENMKVADRLYGTWFPAAQSRVLGRDGLWRVRDVH